MEHSMLWAVWPTWLTVIGQVLQYFSMVSGALFLPYVAYQKCKPSATNTGPGTTYNYMSQAAPAPAAVTTTAIHQEVQVGGAPAEPHHGGCSELKEFLATKNLQLLEDLIKYKSKSPRNLVQKKHKSSGSKTF